MKQNPYDMDVRSRAERSPAMDIKNGPATMAFGQVSRRLLLLAGLLLGVCLLCLLLGRPSWALPGQSELRKTINTQKGHVDFQHCTGQQVVLKIYYPVGSTVPMTQTTVIPDINGDFFFPDIAVDTYDISVKGAHTLRVLKTNVAITDPPTTINFGTLLEGDANGDNTVNAIDASIMATSYWKSQGQPGYDARADFYCDNQIDARDASLLATNYWQTGAAR
jgi:hypothetical protein